MLMSSMLASFHRGLEFALGGSQPGLEICFEYERPDYVERFGGRLPSLHFNRPQTQYRAPATLLQRPLPTASPEALSTALALCEREAALLDEDQEQIVSTARAAMTLGKQGYPDPAALAERLHMSTRTLRRRLQAEASNYSLLLEDARRRDALQLLENPGLEIQQIAGLLGYADPANFTRAFRSWTGNTPTRYRELRGVG
jgi:AraC-like DNA-binding protein